MHAIFAPTFNLVFAALLLVACGAPTGAWAASAVPPAAKPADVSAPASGPAVLSQMKTVARPAGPPKSVRVGVATSGGTTLPALVISNQKLDEKYGLKIEWVHLDQNALQRAFALRQFNVSFAEVVLDLVRQRARGDKVKSIYSGITSNSYVVVRSKSPYRTMADLKGKKIGLFSLTSSSTAGLVRILRERWGLDLQKDFNVVVAVPPVLAGLLQKGELEGMVNVDPTVLRVLASGEYREIMGVDAEWQKLTGSPLLITTIAAWDDYAQKNPEEMRNLIRTYREALDFIGKNPGVYASTGFVKLSGMEETPGVLKLFDERFAKLYTARWDQDLVNANKAVFETAIQMGNLESLPSDWYTFEYAR